MKILIDLDDACTWWHEARLFLELWGRLDISASMEKCSVVRVTPVGSTWQKAPTNHWRVTLSPQVLGSQMRTISSLLDVLALEVPLIKRGARHYVAEVPFEYQISLPLVSEEQGGDSGASLGMC